MKKSELKHHVNFLCTMRSIKCPFYHFGCHEVLQSLQLSNHLKYNAAQHYQLKVDFSINKIEKMKLQIESLLKLHDESIAKQTALQKQNESLSLQLTAIRKELKGDHLRNSCSRRPLRKVALGDVDLGRSVDVDMAAISNPEPVQSAHRGQREAPDILLLFGSTKWEETGVFIRRSESHEERVCYTSLRTKCAIRWSSELAAWLIDRRGLATDNEASLIAYQDVPDPGLVTNHWLVYNDDIEQWQEASNYRIHSFNLAEFLFKADHIFAQCSDPKMLRKDVAAQIMGDATTMPQIGRASCRERV